MPNPRSTLVRLAAASAALSTAAAAHAQIVRYVDDDAPAGGNGTSWNLAFKDLTDALAGTDTSPEPVEIRIAQGTYKPDRGTGLRSKSFVVMAPTVQSGVTLWLKGGFAGRGAINPDLRDPETFVTVLSGDLNGDDLPGFVNRTDNSMNVVVVNGLVFGWPSLSGLTIRGGNTSGQTGPTTHGGGVSVWSTPGSGSGPVFEDCIIADNQSAEAGGGYSQSSGGHPTLLRCIIANNRAINVGGGLNLYDVTGALLTDCTVRGNRASEGAGIDGSVATSMRISSCRIENNVATASFATGAGMHVGGKLHLVNSLVLGNISPNVGGGLVLNQTKGQISEIVNCTFVQNSAARGGAFALGQHSSAGTFLVMNTIVWNNTSTVTPPALITGAECIAVVANCDIEGGRSGFGTVLSGGLVWGDANLDLDPKFVDLPMADARLGVFSPCIDSGDDSAVPTGIVTDLLGNPRFQDDPWMVNGGPGHNWIVDIGAYEAQGSSCYADCNSDLVLNLSDFGCFQSRFAVGNLAADCNGDGLLSLSDFGCFTTKFALGCP